MKIVAISLALGDIYKDGGLGEINQPIDGAIERFNTVIKYEPSLVICTAGYSRKSPRKPVKERQVSLSDQLQRYIKENEKWWNERLIAKPLTWSTRNEIRLGIKLAIREGFDREDEDVILVVASNFSHLVRIWLYLRLYAPQAWNIKMVRAHHKFTLFSHFLEMPKFLRDLRYLCRIVWRRSRQLEDDEEM